MKPTVRRRTLAAAIPLLLAACGRTNISASAGADTPLTAAPRTLALGAADLPGFTLREELAPAPRTAAADDPFGRLGSYSVTYERAGGTLITSSINTYVGAAHARAAFDAWRAAVPRQYRAIRLSVGMDDESTAAYARDADGSVLIGYRVRNVLGSLRAPAGDVERLTRLMLARCNKG